MTSLHSNLVRGDPRVVVLVAAIGCGVPASAQPALPLRSDPLAGLCTVAEGPSQVQTQRPPEAPKSPAPPPSSNARPSREALGPPREAEIQELGRVLKELAKVETSGATLAGLGEGRPFSTERFAVLVGDVRSIVVHLHAQELLHQLREAKGLDAETRQGLERDAGAMAGCGPSRFENRGGLPIFEQVVAVVTKHRRQLEPLIFQNPGQPPQTTAPPPQREKPKKRQ